MRRIASACLLCACAILAMTGPTLGVETRQFARAGRYCAELVEWLATAGRSAANSAELVEEVEATLAQISRRGEDISPELVRLVRRDVSLIRARGTIDAALLSLLSRRPDLCEPAWNLVIRLGLRDLEPRISKISAELGSSAPAVIEALATRVPERDAVLFMRGISGRSLSRESVVSIARGIECSGLSPRDKGESWECLSRALLSNGSNKSVSGLRDGAEVVCGQYNGVHGIDGVGASPEGRPVIFEFSMYESKALGATKDGVQLSPEWTASRWNSAMEDPGCLAEFRRIGVDPRYLHRVTPAEAANWARKLVVAHESALTDVNRTAAGLGMQDLFALGGN